MEDIRGVLLADCEFFVFSGFKFRIQIRLLAVQTIRLLDLCFQFGLTPFDSRLPV